MMKKIYFGALAVAALGFMTACQNDEPGNKNNAGLEGESYLAVKISTATSGTRADETYEVGSEGEGTITAANTRFFFFDESGNAFNMTYASNVNTDVAITTNMVAPKSINVSNTPGNITEGNVHDGVLVLGKAAKAGYQGMVPFQAVCVAGGVTDDVEKLAGLTLSQLAKTVASGDNLFLMTSSVWNAVKDVNGAVTIADKVKGTPEDAQNAPAFFYIERLGVRVDFKQTGEGENKTVAGFDSAITAKDKDDNTKDAKYRVYKADGTYEDMSFDVKLNDWKITKGGTDAYVIKQIPETLPSWSWDAADYHRSFWADSYFTYTGDAQPYDIYDTNTWKGGKEKDYCYESTHGTASGVLDRTSTTAAVIIRGTISKKGQTDGFDLVKYAGAYYELAAFQQMVKNNWNANPANKDNQIEASDVTLVLAGDGNYFKVQVKDKDYAAFSKVTYWKGGRTSFYMNIDQTPNLETANFGVVRNHIYRYDISDIVGLGVPGDGPDDPETETFVAARLYVLDWHVISNTVVLE